MIRSYQRERDEGVRTIRGIRNGLTLIVLLFWLPLILLLTWWVG
jgi:hypothetical protein